MRKKIIFSIILFLILLLFAGCDRTKDENLVWEAYSTSDFGIMYPGGWEKTSVGNFVRFYNDNEDEYPELQIGLEGVSRELDKEEFIDSMEEVTSGLEDEFTEVLKEEEITIDTQPAYRVITEEYEYGEEDTKRILVYTYKEDKIAIIIFIDRKNNFESSKEIGNEMIDSFEFLY